MMEKVPKGWCDLVKELTEALRLGMDEGDKWDCVVGDVAG